ncbi:hypothetical protein, partial [Hahella sp. HN01]|uniref:hypothetical protein n=1 Tax=Hahella sp. HN01 TaxID=2847262 RepID=UPI001C1EC59B
LNTPPALPPPKKVKETSPSSFIVMSGCVNKVPTQIHYRYSKAPDRLNVSFFSTIPTLLYLSCIAT